MADVGGVGRARYPTWSEQSEQEHWDRSDTERPGEADSSSAGVSGAGRERYHTWPEKPQEYQDSSDDIERPSEASDTERLSETSDTERPSDGSDTERPNEEDVFDDDIRMPISSHCSTRPRQDPGYISVVLSNKKMMGEHPSYHQSITSREAERRLKIFGKNCCYLTRYSKTQNCYVLSVFRKQYPDDAIEHLGIVIDDKGRYKVKGNNDKIFSDINSLLLHYETHRINPAFPNIGQSYREDEFIRQQQDERQREEKEMKKKEEEQKHLIELEQERIKLLRELQEAKDAAEAAEQRKQQALQEAEYRKQEELEAAEERKRKELQAAEDRKQKELEAAEERKRKELEAAEVKRLRDIEEAKRCTIS